MGGKFVAYFLIFTGFANLFVGNFGGLWLAFIGFFLLALSTMSYEQVVIKDALTGVKAGDFAKKRFDSVSPGTSLKQAVVKQFIGKDANACVVLDDGALVGVLTIGQAQGVAKKQWAKTKVKEVMMPAKKVGQAGIATSAYNALVKMLKSGLEFVVVVERKKVVGVVRRDDVLRYVRFREKKERLEKMGFEVK
jgi:predicted transcriptional regulator